MEYGFDVMTGAGSGVHDFVFLAGPTADGREDERIFEKVWAFEIGQNPFVEDIGRNKGARVGEVLMSFFFHGTDNDARGKEFSAEGFGEFDALSVFAGHRQTENIYRAGAEPLFDCFKLIVHKTIISWCCCIIH